MDYLFGFTGQQFDGETGLTYMKARYYDPNTGRMLAEDPIGLSDPNLYRYVGNSPTNATDPTGMVAKSLSGFSSFRQQRDPGFMLSVPMNTADFGSFGDSPSFATSVASSHFGSSQSYAGLSFSSSMDLGTMPTTPMGSYGALGDIGLSMSMGDGFRAQAADDAYARQQLAWQQVGQGFGSDQYIASLQSQRPNFYASAWNTVKLWDNATVAQNYRNLRGSDNGVLWSLYGAVGTAIADNVGVSNLEDARSGRDFYGNQLTLGERAFRGTVGSVQIVGTAVGLKAGGSQFFGPAKTPAVASVARIAPSNSLGIGIRNVADDGLDLATVRVQQGRDALGRFVYERQLSASNVLAVATATEYDDAMGRKCL